MKKIIRIIITVLTIIILLLASFVFALTSYINNSFPDQNVDEMLFYLTTGLTGTSESVIYEAVKKGIFPFILIFLLVLIPIIPFGQRKNILDIKIRNKVINVQVFPIKFFPFKKTRLIYAIFILIMSLYTTYKTFDLDNYIERLNQYSTFIEQNYVSGTDISLSFPNNKKNLIILYLESVENSFMDVESGGGWKYNVIPELTELAKKNINFSNTEKIGGPYPIVGTTWTVGALVASTSGLPLKVPGSGNAYKSDDFLSGAYTLGDILKDEGYNLMFMVGSDATHGGRKYYYKKHGDYRIFDYYTAIEVGKMKEEDKVWWGFEDSKLFEWAKEKITILASKEEPFSFTFLTVNTHFPDGYLENDAEEKYDSQYENVFAHSSKLVDDFVKWLEQQDFYENTTLVILGDHLSMQGDDYFPSRVYEGYERTIYNVFINSEVEPINTKNRVFTSLDYYPTILASIGVEIEGNRLGLGTNLFSDKQTLVEEYGLEYVDQELRKNSLFYNSQILSGDYLDLLKKRLEQNK